VFFRFSDGEAAGVSGPEALLGVYAFAFQIYGDFSGYSDMAIGIAHLFGFKLHANFDLPYLSANIAEFWRRWHISLSSWLRDYLYIPLGGSRHGRLRLYAALMTTMLLGGLWHGASWNFVIWGLLHGGVLAGERLWRDVRPAGWPRLPHALGIVLTFHIVTLSWIFFRSSTFESALAFLGGIAGGSWAATILTPLGLFLILLGMALHFLPPQGTQRLALRLRPMPAPLAAAAVACTILVIDAMRPEGVAPFIYYQF